MYIKYMMSAPITRRRRYHYVSPTQTLTAIIQDIWNNVPRTSNVTITLYANGQEMRLPPPNDGPPIDKEQRRQMFDNLPSRIVKEDESNTACAICLDPFKKDQKLTKLLCNHEMHSDCAFEWLVGHDTCPVCRFETM